MSLNKTLYPLLNTGSIHEDLSQHDSGCKESKQTNDLCLHCLTKRLLKHFSRRQLQRTKFMTGGLRVKAA